MSLNTSLGFKDQDLNSLRAAAVISVESVGSVAPAGPGPGSDPATLLESGDYLLLESGDRILLG